MSTLSASFYFSEIKTQVAGFVSWW